MNAAIRRVRLDVDPEQRCEREHRVLKYGEPEAIGQIAAPACNFNESGFPEDVEVSRHRGSGDHEVTGEFPCGHRLPPQEFEDSAARGVCQSFEDTVHISIFSEISSYDPPLRGPGDVLLHGLTSKYLHGVIRMIA